SGYNPALRTRRLPGMDQWASIWFQWVHDWGYPGIILLMAMESSVLPIPSEIVIPPAAYWAAQGRYNFVGVVVAGSLGSYLGGFAVALCALYVLVMRLTAKAIPSRP